MRYVEIDKKLTEYSIEKVVSPLNKTEIIIYINPHYVALKKIINESLHHQLRYIWDGDDKFYFWDAGLLVHKLMAEQLGLDINECETGYLISGPNNQYYLTSSIKSTNTNYFKNNFRIKDNKKILRKIDTK